MCCDLLKLAYGFEQVFALQRGKVVDVAAQRCSGAHTVLLIEQLVLQFDERSDDEVEPDEVGGALLRDGRPLSLAVSGRSTKCTGVCDAVAMEASREARSASST